MNVSRYLKKKYISPKTVKTSDIEMLVVCGLDCWSTMLSQPTNCFACQQSHFIFTPTWHFSTFALAILVTSYHKNTVRRLIAR